MNENMSDFQKMVGERKAGHILMLVKLFLLVLVLYFGVSTAKLWRSQPAGELPRQLAVSGEGKTTVKPDIAVFTATVVTQATKVKDAQTANTTGSNAVLEFLNPFICIHLLACSFHADSYCMRLFTWFTINHFHTRN